MKKYKNQIIIAITLIGLLISVCFIPIRISSFIPMIEEQVEKEIGVKVHIERLVLRLGPSIKVKTPIMHIMYKDGEKFAQLDNAKFYLSWNAIFKKNYCIKKIKAKKLNVRLTSDNKNLQAAYEQLRNANINDIPSIKLKEYKISYLNKDDNDLYKLEGSNFILEKSFKYKNFKVKANGVLYINAKKHIIYDLVILPDINNISINIKNNIIDYVRHIKELDFYSDIVADIKLYNDSNKNIQASGFINIDNISILEADKKAPKSFIYLTLWGDKASILSNIYTSPNKKIYIEGMVNNSKKPILDIKVKTDEINIQDLYKKLQILIKHSYLNNIKKITGTLNANFSLKGDLNRIKSSGFLNVSNASIDAAGIHVDNIDSEIDFSNNTVSINKAIGYVNNSPIIVKGGFNKDINLEVLMNKIELKYLCPSNLGLKNGTLSLIAKVNGTLKDIVHKESILIENFKIENNNLNLDFNEFKLDTNKSNIAEIQAVSCKTPDISLLKIPSAKILFNPNQISIPDTNIYMPNSKLKFKGNFVNFNNEVNFVSSLDGVINSKDITKLSKHSNQYPIKLTTNGSPSNHNINLQIMFEKPEFINEPVILNLSSKIEKNNIKIEDLSLIPTTGSFSEDSKQNLKGNKKVIITGLIEDIKKPVMKNMRIFIPQIINLNISDFYAQLKGDVFINGKLNNPEIIGQIYLQNLINQPLDFSMTNSTFDFNKNNIVVNSPLIKADDTNLSLNALISTDFSSNINVKNLNIKSKYLNTDTLLMYKDSPLFKNIPLNILDGKLYSEKVLANVYGSSVYLTALTSEFKVINNVLTLKNIAGELFNGKISGTLDYNLKDEQYKSKLMARGVSAEPIFTIISSRKDNISGTMDFDATLEGNLTSKSSLLGNIKFIINNGRMSTLGKLEHLLYAQNVIADSMLRTSLSVVTKAITLKDTGLFKYLRGDVDIQNDIANIKFIQTQGPQMALYIRGQYNTLNNTAKLIVLGRLSDEIITGLGAFGDFSLNKLMIMLTGEETKNYISQEDINKLPQLPVKNTKEFRTLINGFIDKPSSVLLFNWISYSQKSLKQKEVPMGNTKLPEFLEAIP